ncbi:MAG: DUF3644 domain-containing protein [Ilumatobacter sp.]|uniref:DUF3644 domain-containing protein n=1 Tax=Ilumatobacter sp. TaxID=1967498 RepID=UPI00391ADF32
MAAEKLTDDEHRQVAKEMHALWQAGARKSQLEIDFWGNTGAHGKAFSGYVKRWLGVATESKSKQSGELERLRGLLRAHGISPSSTGDLEEEFRLVGKSRDSALAAVRIQNDPIATFRTETFILLMIIAWNSLFQAILERDGVDYYERDDSGRQVKVDGRPRVLDTWKLMSLAIGAPEWQAVRCNVDFFLGLRNQIAHRYLPALDVVVLGEAQAMRLNFERLLSHQFGDEAALGTRLSVPLQLSGFRNSDANASFRRAQAKLPTDVSSFLAQHRHDVPEEVLESAEYCLRIFLVPVTANHEHSADAAVHFVPMDKVTPAMKEELQQLGVVTKRRRTPVASADLLRPSEVVNLVVERPPYRFTMTTHTRCWRHYEVRPADGAKELDATDDRYCIFDRLSRGYGYTQAWVEKIVRDLSKPATYETVVGIEPDMR